MVELKSRCTGVGIGEALVASSNLTTNQQIMIPTLHRLSRIRVTAPGIKRAVSM
jgi:hypothetical protein